jgi:hypothetical protein
MLVHDGAPNGAAARQDEVDACPLLFIDQNDQRFRV